MYVPDHFAVGEGAAPAILAATASGELITSTAVGLLATHVPFLFDAATGLHGTVLGHLARNNGQWQHAATTESLLIATGANGYVSPSWYQAKAEHGRVVPTWNYTTVHAYGAIAFHQEPQWLEMVVTRLTDQHEGHRPQPWSVSDAPRDYVDGMLRAIVGFELTLTRIEVKAKLSQNRPAADIRGVVAGLTQDGNRALADQVRQANDLQ